MSGFPKNACSSLCQTTGFVVGAAAALAATCFAVGKLTEEPVPDNAVVVVTGGSRGLGYAIASRFAQKPVRLVLASRKRDELEEAQNKLLAAHPHLQPADFYLVDVDLSERAGCERLVDETIARFGRIDVLVNNAGIIEVGPVEALTLESFEQAMSVNFFAALYTTWAALPHMMRQQPISGKRRAAIVNIASIGGKFAVPHMLPYSAAKFALVGFSEGLHAELRAKGVRVTTVCPGLMRTGGEAHAKFVGNVDAEKKWFDFAAKTPGVATTAEHAARRIYSAVVSGRAEITITPQAWLGARFAGVFPETLQWMNALANEYALPQY
ncbi:SDR family NAD(P)-dependent oxidoreductase [Granulicella cerasi]|uniref:SDR family NAD(P)-dependent oxidoreductase n=1 Tax=Granulicella cerasi TaxID=741063 RepID=A0ABW1Z797_9BACT|nr:SDR family oxidoreductase [Granulicella cerasi]